MKQENENYTVKEEAETVTILDNSLNIGLRFMKGETLQYYNADLLLNDFSRMNNEQEQKRILKAHHDLIKYAVKIGYKKEFQQIK